MLPVTGESPWGGGGAASRARRRGPARGEPGRGRTDEPAVPAEGAELTGCEFGRRGLCWLAPGAAGGAVSRARAVSRELLSGSCEFLSVKRFGTETFGLMFCQQWEVVVEADPGA